MKARALLFPVVLACVGSTCAACSESDGEASPTRETLDSLIANVMLPMLERFEKASERLEAGGDALCGRPSEDGLARARAAWQAARSAWRRMDVLSFGPQTLPPWRLSPQIDFWPARVDDLDAVLAGELALTPGGEPDAGADDVDDVDDVDAEAGAPPLGAAQKGLPAIEYVLYGANGELDVSAFGADDGGSGGPSTEQAQRCAYLRVLGADLHVRARELRLVWEQEFVPELTLEAGGDRYESLGQSFGALVNNLAFNVEVLRDERLGKPLGVKNGGTPDPTLVESRFAGRAVQDARDTLRGIDDMLYGQYAGNHALGIIEALARRDEARGRRFAANARVRLDAAYDALDALGESLAQSVLEHPERVIRARDQLRELLVLLQVDLTQALSVTVTFGGADGD